MTSLITLVKSSALKKECDRESTQPSCCICLMNTVLLDFMYNNQCPELCANGTLFPSALLMRPYIGNRVPFGTGPVFIKQSLYSFTSVSEL